MANTYSPASNLTMWEQNAQLSGAPTDASNSTITATGNVFRSTWVGKTITFLGTDSEDPTPRATAVTAVINSYISATQVTLDGNYSSSVASGEYFDIYDLDGDTYINSGATTANYSTLDTMRLGNFYSAKAGDRICRILLRFDLYDFVQAGSEVTGAQLRLECTGAGTSGLDCHIFAMGWNETAFDAVNWTACNDTVTCDPAVFWCDVWPSGNVGNGAFGGGDYNDGDTDRQAGPRGWDDWEDDWPGVHVNFQLPTGTGTVYIGDSSNSYISGESASDQEDDLVALLNEFIANTDNMHASFIVLLKVDEDWDMAASTLNVAAFATQQHATGSYRPLLTIEAKTEADVSPIAVTASIPTPTWTSSFSPSAIAVTASVPTPGLTATEGATAIGVTATIPTPTVGSSVSVSAIAVTASVPTPGLAATENASAITTTATVPSVTLEETVSVSAIAVATSVPTPGLEATANVSAIAVAASIPTPGLAATENAGAIAVTATVPTPGLTATESVSAIAVTASVPTPSIGYSVSPSAIAVTAAIPGHTMSVACPVDAIAVSAQVPTPGLAAVADVSVIAATAAIPTPTVGTSLDVTAIAVTAVVPVPGLTATVDVSAISVVAVIPTPTVGSSTDVTAIGVSAAVPSVTTAAAQDVTAIAVVAVIPSVTYTQQRDVTVISVTATIPTPGLQATENAAAIAVTAVLPEVGLGDWGIMIEPGIDAKQALRLCLAAVTGTLSGANGSTVTIKDPAGTNTRIVAGVDARGNRDVTNLSAGDPAAFDDGWGDTLETGITIRQGLATILSMLAGDLAVSGTSSVATKAADGAAARVQQSVDRYGNRSSVTVTPPSY